MRTIELIQSDIATLKGQLAELESEEKQFIAQRKQEIVAEINKTIARYGINAKEINVLGKIKEAKKSISPAKIKYRGPGGESWSGRGLKPRWLTAQLEQGRNLADFLVAVE